MTLRERITIDPDQCGGQPCIRHLRMRVCDVLGMLAAGETPKAILGHHPDLEAEDIAACQAFAKHNDAVERILTVALVAVTLAYAAATVWMLVA